MELKEQALKMHADNRGKLAVESKVAITCAAELLLGEDLAAKCEVVVAMR